MRKVLVPGVNGFIGHHLSKRVLEVTDWEVYDMDVQIERLDDLVNHPRMHFFENDITINKEWAEYHMKGCGVILLLATIAMPSTYTRDPLRVFKLDFETSLLTIRFTAKYSKHLIFPSISEIYGMYSDSEFDLKALLLACNPIDKPRWIYARSEQLIDCVIQGCGMEDLNSTLLRPFSWIGSGLDSTYTPEEGSSCVVTQSLGHIVRDENIKPVDGGSQKYTFTYTDDGIDALVCAIANENGVASGKIYDIGNPSSNYLVRKLANMALEQAAGIDEYKDTAKQVQLVETTSGTYYGNGYQDVQNRMPKIANTMEDLGWKPTTTMKDALANIFEVHWTHVVKARSLVEDGNGNR